MNPTAEWSDHFQQGLRQTNPTIQSSMTPQALEARRDFINARPKPAAPELPHLACIDLLISMCNGSPAVREYLLMERGVIEAQLAIHQNNYLG